MNFVNVLLKFCFNDKRKADNEERNAVGNETVQEKSFDFPRRIAISWGNCSAMKLVNNEQYKLSSLTTLTWNFGNFLKFG